MRTLFCRSLIFFICMALFVPETGFSRLRRTGRGPFIKGFNPCGWNTCRPSGSRLARRPFFQRGFSRGGGGCSSGSCGGGQRMQASQHDGGCASGNCGNSGGGFAGGGQSSPRPVDNAPFDSSSNQRNLDPGGGPEGDFDRAPSLDDEGDLAQAPSLDEETGSEESEGAKIFEQRCQKCHEAEKEDIIGALKDWGKEEWERAIAAVENGSMPKGSELSDEDKKKLIEYLKEKAGLNKEEANKEQKPEPQETPSENNSSGTEQAQQQPASEQAGGSSAGAAGQAPQQQAANSGGTTPHSGSAAGGSAEPATPSAQQPAQAAAGNTDSSWLDRDAILGNWKDRIQQLANPFLNTGNTDDATTPEPSSASKPKAPTQKKEPEKAPAPASPERETASQNPDNEFTLGVKEALTNTTAFQEVLKAARERSAEGYLLEAIRQEKSLPENSSPASQAKLNRWEAQIEAQWELGDLSQKTQSELLSARAQADIRDVPGPGATKDTVKRELIEQELARRQEARQSEVRQQNIQRMKAVQAQKQVQETQDELRKAMRELQKANRALGKPRLRGLKKNQKGLDPAAIRKAKAQAMERAINANKGVVPALQDPKAILSTPSPVYRVLQAGQNIEELIQAYEKALEELNSLRK